MDASIIIAKTEAFFLTWGYLTVFWGSLVETTPLGWAVPGGVILTVAGFFANNSAGFSLSKVIITGWLGAWLAFLGAYFLGRKTGMWFVNKLKQQKNADRAKHLLAQHGGVILTTSMLANLTRFWIAYIAGVEKYGFLKFLLYSGAASLGWVSIMSVLGFLAGFERQNLERLIGAIGILAWGFLALAVFVLFKSIKHEYQHFKKDEPHNENY